MQIYLEKMGRNFMVAAFVPSLAFVTAAMVTFGPIIPPVLFDRLQSSFDPIGESGLVFLIFTVITGFTLSGSQIFIYKVFEGYFFLEHFPFLISRQQKNAERLKEQLRSVERELELLHQEGDEQRIQELKDMQYYIASTHRLKFPPSKEAILPTQFGNILRAAEFYPVVQYGLDAVPIWSRLVQVIPDEYRNKIDGSNNNLTFFINCSLLCLIFALLCSLGSLYQYIVFRYALVQQSFPIYFVRVDYYLTEIYQQRAILYLIECIAALFVARLFYRASLTAAIQYGNLIRGSYDLFRFRLLKQMNLPLPEDSDEEYDTWRKVSEFLTVGDSAGMLFFEYQEAKTLSQASGSSERISTMSIDKRVKLRQMITNNFNSSELQNLCFDLGVDYESLSGTSKEDKARELIVYFQRHGRTPELIAYCLKNRPDVPWGDSNAVIK